MTTASICTIGDEILIGQIVDTNSSSISRRLGQLGIRVTRMISIGDDHDQIVTNLRNELKANNIVIVTGGLGPTKDDITKAALAELSEATSWHTDEEQLEVVNRILSNRGLQVLDINKAQALVPDTCKVIVNRKGTAPIMAFHFPARKFRHKAALYSMPGVPYETEAALDDVLDDIKQNFETTDIYHRNIMTFGLAESALAKKIEEWEDALPEDMHLAYLPNMVTGVKLRLSIYGGIREEEEARIDAEVAKLRPILGDIIYSEQEDTLQEVIGRMLQESHKTMSAAESCTGGRISSLMTGIAGCSEYYLGSVTSYANEVKEKVLGVPASTIDTFGAVSSETVALMADGVRRKTGSDFAVATSGIAGPGGGTPDKPVGTVWIGVSSCHGTETMMYRCTGDRERNIQRFAAHALDMLRLKIKKETR